MVTWLRRLRCWISGTHQDVRECWAEQSNQGLERYVGLRCDHCGAETVREVLGFSVENDSWYAGKELAYRRNREAEMREIAARHRTTR